MKHKLLYLLPLLLAFVFGCSTKNTPIPVPSGMFTGHFTRYHLNVNGSIDSAKANLTLVLQNSAFSVTGDTSAVHAGSFGTYYLGTINLIQFVDKTYPPTGTPAKTHLSGIYQYYFDGTVFQMVNNTDSLDLLYNFKKTGN